jgi:hypothetical protein
MIAGISVLVLALVLTTPRLADAACVWVLWGFVGGGQWRPVDTFESKSRCVEGQRTVYAGIEEDVRLAISQCLPDTVDPRGPSAYRR